MSSTEEIVHATVLEGYEWARLKNPMHYNFECIGRLKHVSEEGVMLSFVPGSSCRVEVLDVEPVNVQDVPEKILSTHYYR